MDNMSGFVNLKVRIMKKLLVFLVILIPVFSMAHPGHGVAENNGLVHLLLSHGYLVGFAIMAMVFGLYLVRKANKQ